VVNVEIFITDSGDNFLFLQTLVHITSCEEVYLGKVVTDLRGLVGKLGLTFPAPVDEALETGVVGRRLTVFNIHILVSLLHETHKVK